MGTVIICILFVLAIIYIVPFIIYGIASIIAKLEPPKGVSLIRFLISVLISKIGVSISFVLIYIFAEDIFESQLLLYTLLWFIMFFLAELGQAIGPNYSWKEALLGIISEVIYTPLSTYVVSLVIK